MQTKNTIFRLIALWGLVATICIGCQNEVEELAVQQESVTIELSVSTNDVVTRATPTDSEMVINSLRIYAFYNNRQAGYIYRAATTPDTPFYMDLELPENGTHNVEFYLIVNEASMVNAASLTEKMSKDAIESITFSSLTNSGVLPMYCKQVESINVNNILNNINTINGHNGHPILGQKINFELERPLAKLSVYAAKTTGAASSPQITKIEYLASGTRIHNYLFPQSDEVLNGIASRANNRILLESGITIEKEITKGSSEAASPENYTEIITDQYMAEVATGSTAWHTPSSYNNAAALRIEYTLGEGKKVNNTYVYLPPLQRNHHVKVCILINAEGQLVVNYVVADWEDNEMQDYHFDYPTHSFLREFIPTGTPGEATIPSGAAKMNETTPFKGYFQMSQPSNDAWTPTLLGLNGANCEIRVYEANTNTEVTTFPIDASGKWYRIEVWPLINKMDLGDETMLAISYTASGLTESEFLLINGSKGDFYWPYTGTSAEDPNYVIITMGN